MTNKERMDKILTLLTEASELSSDINIRDFKPDEVVLKGVVRDYLPHLNGRVLESTMWAGAMKEVFDGQAEQRKAKQLDDT